MKKYVSDVIGKDYLRWKNGKVFINFPTGCGKSHFILNVFLPYLQAVGKRALILCNRKLLRQQYWYDAVKRFANYTELKNVATIETYQGLYQRLLSETNNFLENFDVVIFDEYHFFLADAQFNGAGTYILAQMLVDKCLRRLMIFMTATPNEVEPLFDNLLATCYKHKLKRCQPGFDYSPLAKCFSYGDPMAIDSSRFKCYAVPDEESLLEKIADSEGKSVLFIDNRYKAEQWRKSLMKNNKFEGKDIMLLNSENLEENSEFVARLSIANVVDSRILITTSVLDNGVTIHDPEVKNLVIITESQTSFLQMLGRLRSESSEEVNLYFLIRDADFFQERMLGVKTDLERIEDIKNAQNSLDSFLIASTVWNNPTDKLAEFYRRYLVVTRSQQIFFDLPEDDFAFEFGEMEFRLNTFAIRNLEYTYFALSKLYSLAVSNPLNVVLEQMRWMNKQPADLTILQSSYVEKKENELVELLLTVSNYTVDQLKEIKKKIVSCFRGLFPEIDMHNGSIENKKLEYLCERYDLTLNSSVGSDNRRRYTINQRGEECNG